MMDQVEEQILLVIMLTIHYRLSEWSTALPKVITAASDNVSRTANLSAGLDLKLKLILTLILYPGVGYKARHPTTKFDCRLTVVWVSAIAHVSFLVLRKLRSHEVT